MRVKQFLAAILIFGLVAILVFIVWIIMLFRSCDEKRFVTFSESETFRVMALYGMNFLDVDVWRKGDDDKRRVLSVEVDLEVELRIIDDSILIVTDIHRTADGEIALMANLQDDNVTSLDIGSGEGSFLDEAREIDSLAAGQWAAVLYQMKDRDDMFLLTVRSPRDLQFDWPPEGMVVLGAKSVQLNGIQDGLLKIVVTWRRSGSPQRFGVVFSADSLLTPDRISVLP